ncbi:MAG: serine--tRNA ligase [Myxococcales bacterium]|nr:serine--tRNA ligase [Myxococcales bacterium]
MLDFRQVGEDLEGYRRRLARRPGFDLGVLDRVKELYEHRSAALTETQRLQATKNEENKRMQQIFRSGTDEDKARAREEQKAFSQRIKDIEDRATALEAELERVMLGVPNAPHDSVPDGRSEEDNVVVRTVGEKPSFGFEPRDHVTIAGDLWGQLDAERAATITGSRFSVLRDDLARLERALASFMLDVHVREHGYREVSVPYLVNSQSLVGTGQLPKFEEDQFRVPFSENVDYWLIPTAEVPVTNLYADTIVEAHEHPLPHAFCAWTPCFRKEAGSAGRDTRGLMRQHQFHKVELVRFCAPEVSQEEHETLVGHAEAILQKLELHYRVSLLSAGDMGANASKCYDLEVWLPGEGRYREISSCSNFEDYQARRAKIRFRPDPKQKPRLLHTLNGSGLAVGRTIIAIVEQHQLEDGRVKVPSLLRPYLGGVDILPTVPNVKAS